uniref:Uncharacterized protein n=1 Tax=Eucampia antarctica TaxID=49252 RepID=A0A6U0SVR4_9STRA|mmetsp:Transcript_28780/g.27701  ORF Transcript_28780/g.27701 Transcript_28780/m.27701 type:complete len:134 (+) Transcript_28780:31-432(+)
MATKIPPHIARELRRHIGRSTNSNPLQKNISNAGERSKIPILIGCTIFTCITFSVPFIATHWIGSLNERDEALNPSSTRRGAFNNSGSRDAGKDPMWDFKTGTRIKDKDYVDLFTKDNPNEIDHGDKFVAKSK